MELSQEAPDVPDQPLALQVRLTLQRLRPPAGADAAAVDQAIRNQADAIMELLVERGHFLIGAPPAAKILADAKSFAERLTLSNLALRLFAMLGALAIETPETKPAKRWIVDYIEGNNHGPVGKPMLWPDELPGLAHMLRDWGFEPTPTTPAFVARALPFPTVQ